MQEVGGRQLCRARTDWEVEVVKGKVSSRCFWNACKALSFGLLLMFIGTTMAILGYYADQLSVGQEMRGNTTVRIKHEARGFHLNNLSYAGPIVMGVGGFIVVAACVMTFEARDSAAKVVPTPRTRQPSSYPARNKSSRMQGSVRSGGDSRRSTSCQTKWEGRASPAPSDQISRRALTAAFVQFSRELGSRPQVSGLNKSPSAPDLVAQPPPRLLPTSCALLSPHYLLQRQALSVDNPDYGACFSPTGRGGSRQSLELAAAMGRGSQVSMAMDLHLECPVTLRVRDRTRRIDSRRLVRQRPVENDDYDTHSWSPRYLSRDEEMMPVISRSTPHSRRESMAKTPSQGSTEYRSRANTADSVKRRRSREMRRKSCSRSISDRSDRASPLDDQHEIVVVDPEET
ncbi:uncharacterized protein LOC106667300 [Cimex lectularius]|uniref:Transmembrane protein 200A n=1 Tax=Cimex lectularius TaxID=79782 RepID=A0A8I6RQI2_CIMLE|nr:uncharacterized protein LOC106667300 [Cimex lectularius]XP_024080820.1 uncharacterized protein LOC106667300 [Cimex lectularius]